MLFIALVSFLTINKGLNLHTHHTADGHTVVHAHPYVKKDAQGKPVKHHHTHNEEILIESLNHNFTADSTSITVEVSFIDLDVSFYFIPTSHTEVNTPGLFLRGPPNLA